MKSDSKYEPKPVAIRIKGESKFWAAITQDGARPKRIHDEPLQTRKDATDFSRAWLRRMLRGHGQ